MTVEMPHRVELPLPPGDPEALDELIGDVAVAEYWLAILADRLSGPASDAPGWIGGDAAAAATQVGRVAALTHAAATSVQDVTGRLGAHAECLREARRRVEGLRQEQDEDFRAAGRRLARIKHFQVAPTTELPEAHAIVADLEAAEASRRRRCEGVIEEVEDDAAAAGRVLADACAVVGGSGVPGDAVRVVAHLAAELPGWGNLEMARLGRAAAGALTAGTPEDLEAAAHAALAYAGATPFADALLTALGVEGMTWLLRGVGLNTLGPSSDVSRLLAAALGGAGTDGRGQGPVAAVVGAGYVEADDRYGESGIVAAGMVAVLAAGRSLPSAGLQTSTVGQWARQLLLWEHEQGMPAGTIPPGWPPELHDPAALAVGILARRGDPAVSARLLGDARVWEASLARAWPDGGVQLGEVIAQAGQEPGTAGARAVRNGLVVIGVGLFAGDPSDWTVDRDTVTAVSPALGSAVAAHVSVVAHALAGAADGQLADYSADLLRGLGTVTGDREAAASVGRALYDWTVAQPRTDGGAPLTVVVPSAYFAVQEYGQRLPHALDGYEKKEAAEFAEAWWDHTIGLAADLVPGPAAIPLGVAEGYAAILLGADGTWDNGPDRGLDFDGEGAAAAVLARLTPEQVDRARQFAEQSLQAFDGAADVLGHPKPPTSPRTDWLEPVVDGFLGLALERLKRLPTVVQPN